ncbi:hypothetical protein [Paraburkholderia phytofirmans]|uniref:hypothetical protein n=1 Tax=Paraburkholderia phytofirmans TaxID=261302 RepID=UPI0011DF3BA5|nr:hypothetical protein [Paraburkholderia phytofirmans]
MDLWIQPCAACADLYGPLAATDPHDKLTPNGAGDMKDVRIESTTPACAAAAYLCVLAVPPARQIWMLLNTWQP